ncbi:hypothetical protein Tco_0455444 [Tanacetum coccineum]
MSGEEPTTQIAPVESPQIVSTVKLPVLKKGTKDEIDNLDIDDSTQNLKVFEADIKGHNSQGQDSSSSYTDDLMFSFFTNQSNSPQLDDEDLEQIDHGDLEEMDLKWYVAHATLSGSTKKSREQELEMQGIEQGQQPRRTVTSGDSLMHGVAGQCFDCDPSKTGLNGGR